VSALAKTDLELQLDAMPIGAILRYAKDEHVFSFIATSSTGMHSGRRRYCVVCTTCERLLHEATTGPLERMRAHLEGR